MPPFDFSRKVPDGKPGSGGEPTPSTPPPPPAAAALITPRLADEGEGSRAYASLLQYLALGPDRSLRKLARQTGKTRAIYEDRSARFRWSERAARYDDMVSSLRQAAWISAFAADAMKWERRRVQALEEVWTDSVKFREAALALLEPPPADPGYDAPPAGSSGVPRQAAPRPVTVASQIRSAVEAIRVVADLRAAACQGTAGYVQLLTAEELRAFAEDALEIDESVVVGEAIPPSSMGGRAEAGAIVPESELPENGGVQVVEAVGSVEVAVPAGQGGDAESIEPVGPGSDPGSRTEPD